MRIMTFNLRTDFIFDRQNRWRYRSDMVYKLIKKYDCPVIGVQEMNNDMFSDMSSNLENYNFVGKPRTRRLFSERNDILVRRDFKVLESDTFWLSNKPDKQSSTIWYSLFPRICTTAAIEGVDGSKFRVYNTHLDVLLPRAREYQFRKLKEYIDIKAEKDRLPVIIMGDFNARPHSRLIKGISGIKGDNHGFTAVQQSDSTLLLRGTMGGFKGKKHGPHIDYIFVSDSIEILSAEIIEYSEKGKYPSDHYPVMASIKF